MRVLKAYREQLAKRFDACSRRERALLATAVVGGIILIGNLLLIDPWLARARQLNRQAEMQQVEARTLAAQAGAIKAQLQTDPDAAAKAELAQRKSELAAVDAELRALEGDFVPPQQMNALLDRLLAGQPGLRLLALKSLRPVDLAATTDSATSGEEHFGLYRHGVELRLEGSYADLHAWLSQVEKAKQKMLWGDVRFRVVEYPRAHLTVTVYTLSTDKAWLAI